MIDLQAIIVFIICVVTFCALILALSIMVTRGKTYEEALAEQKRMAESLLVTNPKPKPKEKKQKKAGKKVKEKPNVISSSDVTDSPGKPRQADSDLATSSAGTSTAQPKSHVEFKETPELIDEAALNKKEGSPKHDHHKEKSPKEKVNADAKPSKKFPKNQQQLQQEKPQHAEAVSSTSQGVQAIKEEAAVQQSAVAPVAVQAVVAAATVAAPKEKKKKKEQTLLEQITSDYDGINLDLLITLQQEGQDVDDWSEGKADPFQRLKKQFADKEKYANELKETLAAAHNKLKEIRAEQAAEKAQWQQKIRNTEEALLAKEQELKVISQRIASVQDSQQNQLKIEMITNQELTDKIGTLNMQVQQLATQAAQANENEERYKAMITQLQHKIVNTENEIEQKIEITRQLEVQEGKNRNLKQENDNLKAEISQLTTAYQKQTDDYCSLEYTHKKAVDEQKILNSRLQEYEQSMKEKMAHQVEIKNLQNELSSLNALLKQNAEKHAAELDDMCKKLQTDLDQQKEKNNELRKKNWKVIEALNEAERQNKILMSNKNSTNSNENVEKIREQEQIANREFIQRLFPEIKIDDTLTYLQWQDAAETAIEGYLDDLKRPVTPPSYKAKLQNLESYNKHVLEAFDKYDKSIANFNSQLEQSEIEWRKKLESKEAELKKYEQKQLQQSQQLTEKISNLQSQFVVLLEEKKKLSDEFEVIRSKYNEERSNSQEQMRKLQLQLDEKSKEIQRLSEECSELKSKQNTSALAAISEPKDSSLEQQNDELKNQSDSINSSVKLLNNSESSNGPALTEEPCSTSTSMATSSPASSVAELKVNSKRRNRKRKKGKRS